MGIQENMIFTDQIPNDVQQQLSAKVTLLSKVVWPALATLVPAVITAAVRWTQDHSRKRRSAELTERISALAKSISELPELPLTSSTLAVTPRSALTAELDSAVLELTTFQTRASRRFTGVSTTTAKVRAALLLYRPKGLAAWALHTAFYVYSIFIIFCLVAVMADESSPLISTKTASDFFTSLLAFLFIFGVLGIPPLIIRHYAAKIHRRQCAAVVSVATPVSTSQQVI
jgi:hypothetical protein